MQHQAKVYYAAFTPQQNIADKLRRELDAGVMPPADALPDVLRLLYGQDFIASLLAIGLLADHAGEHAVVPLIDTVFFAGVSNPLLSRALRCRALWALCKLAPDDDMVVGTFVAASRDPDPKVASFAAEALSECRLQASRAVTALRPCLQHGDARVRSAARCSLGHLLGAQATTA